MTPAIVGSPTVFKSAEDASVNFVFPNGAEARFVRRIDDYFIAYVSSHAGCDRACRMCHLTQTGQTDFTPQDEYMILRQAWQVLSYYKEEVSIGRQKPASLVHFNFMSRGEPMLSPVMQSGTRWRALAARLDELAESVGIPDIRILISTIMPEGLEYIPHGPFNPAIYYSLYSLNADFRRRWLPKAMDPVLALRRLKQAQDDYGLRVVLHWALIEGENSSVEDAHAIGALVNKVGLRTRFNLVRYNPFSEAQGTEASEETIANYMRAIEGYMEVPGSKIVPRVGFDVHASCGMFTPGVV